jgi:acyl transferase domain-containing protein/SAM-dependent methyltransferase
MEPIAIVGVGCRLPGGSNPAAFWQLLCSGGDAIQEIPSDRWDINKFYDPQPGTPGKMSTRWGGFIPNIDRFDASFFGISPRETERIDPQQRLLLEVAWEAIEDAGIPIDSLAGSQTGVFVASGDRDYGRLLTKDLSGITAYDGTGTTPCIAANRISYALNLQGPSLVVETACSSSLVAVHYACQSLRQQESTLCIVGGVSLMISPEPNIIYSHARMMAADGRCKTFDARADGYVRGEGAVVAVLKRLADAVLDGDRVLAVIHGSAVNQDGLSNGLTAPNGLAQQAVIRQALANAGVNPHQISYVEAHGTGTALGDPIEFKALKAVLMPNRPVDYPCWLGTAKTNVGHLEAASGLVGLIKVALSLYHKKIPPHLHLQQLNPYISLADTTFQIPQALQTWPEVANGRWAGLSSFGFGGTNVHVILEEAPVQLKIHNTLIKDLSYSKFNNEDLLDPVVHLLTVSAKCEKALEDLVLSYHNYIEANEEVAIADICFTANTGRSHFNHRLAIVAADRKELADKLAKISRKEEEPNGIFSGKLNNSTSPKIAFLFTGQGAQYINMGRQLYQTQPVFRQALEQCDRILQSYLEKSLLDIIYPENHNQVDNSVIDQTIYTQPALFAIEYALFQLWQSWGVKPDVVMGHSVGEYVAATVAGVFSLEDGLKLIAHRGRLMQKLPAGGEMVAVMASAEKVNQLITPFRESVAVAAINGGKSVVISGAAANIFIIISDLESQGIKTKRLQVSHAFHSPLMEPILADFQIVANQITYNQPLIPLVSNLTGSRADRDIATANYWVNHITQPVKFFQSMETLHQEGYAVFLEIGPNSTLLGMGRECLPANLGVWLPSLRSTQEDWQVLLHSLGELYVRGFQVDWLGFDRDYSRSKLVLPTYPFQRQRYWIETNTKSEKQCSSPKEIHPLLGQILCPNLDQRQIQFESLLGSQKPSYLGDHKVFGQILFPAIAYLEMALAAGQYQFKTSHLIVENLIIKQGLILSADELKTVCTTLIPLDSKAYQFQIFTRQEQQSKEESEWLTHASGSIKPHQTDGTKITEDLKKHQAQCNQSIDIKQYYQQCQRIGIDYGSSFQIIQKLWKGDNQALGRIHLPQELISATTDYQFHPALLDAALQVIGSALLAVDNRHSYLPVGIDSFKIYGRPSFALWAHASVSQSLIESGESLSAQVTMLSEEGDIIAILEGLQLQKVTPQAVLVTEVESITNWLYKVEWKAKARFGQLLSTNELLTPVEIEQQLNPSLTELLQLINNDRSKQLQHSLQELSIDYVVQALLSMGWSYSPPERFSTEEAAQLLCIAPSQLRLFSHILQILAEVGVLQLNHQHWYVVISLWEVNPTEKIKTLLTQNIDEVATLTLLNRCGSNLSNVLQGVVDPIQLVFPEGDLASVTQIYQDTPIAKAMNTIVQKVVAKAIEKLPQSQGIRLLEIGAGTGGTTSYILPHLNENQTEYVFTDIGSLFTAKAQEKFRDYPFLRYQILDLEVDPVTQGFATHQFDVIIAANVLHATTSLRNSLSHIRQLLAPGGILIIYETTTTSSLWVDLIFGLLEGWWKFTDIDLRPDYPLLSRIKWQQLLSEMGFTQVVTLPEIEGMPEALLDQSIIVAVAEITTEQIAAVPRGWLLCADRNGVAQHLATQLRSRGEICTLVFAGEQYQQISPEEFTINPRSPEEFEQLVATVSDRSPNLYGVVQCWSSETPVSNNFISSNEVESLSQLGCGTTLFLLQALANTEVRQSPRLWLVTQGAQAVSDDHCINISGLFQSSLWGMGKVITLEHPELNCVCVDLDPNALVESQAQALWAEISSEDAEDQVAIRGQDRYVARLVRASEILAQEEKHIGKVVVSMPEVVTNQVAIETQASYLITGGLGALGLEVARSMVDQGADNLILVSRHHPSTQAQEALLQLQKLGARVIVKQADVCCEQNMKSVLEDIKASCPPLRGIIHGAGVLDDGILLEQNWQRFEKVMAPKILGSWNLHSLTQNLSLDFFVCFSSAASLLASPGLGNYAAANAFMDALMHHRQRLGLPGLSINWGPWQSGMGAHLDRRYQSRLDSLGISSITSKQGLQILQYLLGQSTAQVAVLCLDWSLFNKQFNHNYPIPLVLELVGNTKRQALEQLHSVPTSERQVFKQLQVAANGEKDRILTAYFRDEISQILGIKKTLIDVQKPLNTMGIDSLMALELHNKLQSDLSVDVATIKLMGDINIVDLSAEIARQLMTIDGAIKAINSSSNDFTLLTDDNNSNWIEGEV